MELFRAGQRCLDLTQGGNMVSEFLVRTAQKGLITSKNLMPVAAARAARWGPAASAPPSIGSHGSGLGALPPRTGSTPERIFRVAIFSVKCGLEDGMSSNSVPRSTAPSGISNPEKKMSCGTQCPNPQRLSSGPLTQKQNGLRTTEAKRDTKRTSGKEVTISVADSIRQVGRSRRITKNCVN
ncbi:PREDICTED: brain and acute leukemia cytoplasmic protein [Lipotes vexillifer]|uniref:Brain and acute leukemia cytoplasmic protein n=1 Tax=Lipotes vexillifer TaxID=118797 RepID=A0A340Y1Q4_LIPVE|nr:PREDICTED: brain and acute leukemia cytoplasmic protein [Lipotes vexillifer]